MSRVTIAQGLKGIQRVVRDPNRKPLLRIGTETLAYWRAKNEPPLQYFRSFGYREGATDPLAYLSVGERRRLNEAIARPAIQNLLINKNLFAHHFAEAEGVAL